MKQSSDISLQYQNNKENHSHLSNWSISSQRKTRIRLTQADEGNGAEQDDSDIDEQGAVLKVQLKKSHIKRLFGGVLNYRRTKDSQDAKIQIAQEHLCFRAFKHWKKDYQKSKRSQAEAQIAKQIKRYSQLRRCFFGWMSLFQKQKQAITQRKREIFQAFKIVCSIELSLRVKRLRAQQLVIRRQGAYFFKFLKDDKKSLQIKIQRAERHWIRSFKRRIFQELQRNRKQGEDDRLRYRQYQLAFLFRKKTILQRSFNCLKISK